MKSDFRRGCERVKQFLSGTMLLKAISDFCGFENPNSLRKFFKARTGRTMSEWRSGMKVFLAKSPLKSNIPTDYTRSLDGIL